jgi:hypothetical protein
MDPYIEHPNLWPDFHSDLASEIRARLNQVIQPRYFARLTPYVTYEVIEIVPLELPLRLVSVEIRTSDEHQLITVIEILSPVNKSPGHEAYLDYHRKRRDLLRSAAHLMEIDLLRGGKRPPLERPVPPAPYYVVLSRADRRPTVEVWPIQLADKLPVLPVPLLEPDPDVALDLGAAVAAVYERGAYGQQIDYRQPPPSSPLSQAEAAWLDGLLRESGVR